ncbi:tumor necrosis factor receptor superfamily member 1B isoform X1 [Pygocentrus nattereri]|uniref:Si:dkeyp-61b2.1 n=1 Tax=Pygocentrus nattereri TaxID=42514 RepID=A0AAR2L7M7_PYGNA|nr:tumor necrosis factor receptor superfamily member 1B isoform X1 [Pygocentrus nattereri]
MAKSPSPPWLGAFLLLCLLPPAEPITCATQCEHGLVLKDCTCVPCSPGYYWYIRSGVGRCDKCIPSCSDKENKVEVKACGVSTRRECHCKPGFFCPSPTEFNCRRQCEPCAAGTFSSTASLRERCQRYTNCAEEGKVVLREGSSTQDRVCATIPTPTTGPMSTSTPRATKTPTITSASMTTSKPETVPSVISVTTTDAPSATEPMTTSTQLQATYSVLSPVPRPGAIVTSNPGVPVPLLASLNWLFILLLIVFFLLVLTCLSMRCKGRTIKNKLRWPGLTLRKYQLQHLQKPQPAVSSSVSGCPEVEMQIPLGSDITNSARSQGMGPGFCPGGSQQVTMDYNGKGESINNTVGSIFIYSPGMVILGSNSKEKKEEVPESDESVPLMGVPQQESSLHPQDDSVGVGMQEEFGKELSFPVPATSK